MRDPVWTTWIGGVVVRGVRVSLTGAITLCNGRPAPSRATIAGRTDAPGRKDDALARLRYAIGAGFADLAHVETDPDLASLRDDPRWPIKH